MKKLSDKHPKYSKISKKLNGLRKAAEIRAAAIASIPPEEIETKRKKKAS